VDSLSHLQAKQKLWKWYLHTKKKKCKILLITNPVHSFLSKWQFPFFSLVNAITYNLPKPLQVPWGLPWNPNCWQPALQGKLLWCRLQTPQEEWPRMPVRVEAVPMPWNDENPWLVRTTQHQRLSPLLMSATQRAQVVVLLNPVHLVSLWNTTPERSSAHRAVRAQRVIVKVMGQMSLSRWCDICPSMSSGLLELESAVWVNKSLWGWQAPIAPALPLGQGSLGRVQHLSAGS